MTKKQRALQVIERLKKEYRPPAVRLIMIRHGNCLSVCGLRHSVQMPVSM